MSAFIPPPGLEEPAGDGRRDSRERDAELVLIAKQVRDHPEQSWIVTGDFNDVAWSHTTRLFTRLSGLNDPRVGRQLLTTYHAEYPLLRYPIDHVFVSDGFTLHQLERIHLPGSDHFAIVANLQEPAIEGVTPEARHDDLEEPEELVDEGKEDAKENGVAVGTDNPY